MSEKITLVGGPRDGEVIEVPHVFRTFLVPRPMRIPANLFKPESLEVVPLSATCYVYEKRPGCNTFDYKGTQ